MTFKSFEQKELDKEKNKDTYVATVVQHLKLSKLGKDVISDILQSANSLYNVLTYNIQQGYFTYKTRSFSVYSY